MTANKSNPYFHLELQTPQATRSHSVGAHVARVEGLGLLGGQIFKFLLCASPVTIRGHMHVLLAVSSDLHCLSDRLLLEDKREMMTLDLSATSCFISFSLQPSESHL